MDNINILLTGVGGQGVVLASDILGDVALASGCDVKKTDTLGMAQRGGSVVTHMRMGAVVESPMIGEGEADFLLAFEKLEAARWSPYLKQTAFAVVNDQCIPPLSVSLGLNVYPDDASVRRILCHNGAKVVFIEGQHLAANLGNSKALNVLMLGALSVLLPFGRESWNDVIKQRLPAKILDINIEAFEHGRCTMLDKISTVTEGGDCTCGDSGDSGAA